MNVLEFENLTKNWNEWSRLLPGTLAVDGGLPELRERLDKIGEEITIESFIEHAVVAFACQIAESFLMPVQWEQTTIEKRPGTAVALFAAMRFGEDRGDGVKVMETNGKTVTYLRKTEDGEYLIFDSILLKGTPFESPKALKKFIAKQEKDSSET